MDRHDRPPRQLAGVPNRPMPSMSWAFRWNAASPGELVHIHRQAADRGRLCPGAAPSQNDGDPPLAVIKSAWPSAPASRSCWNSSTAQSFEIRSDDIVSIPAWWVQAKPSSVETAGNPASRTR